MALAALARAAAKGARSATKKAARAKKAGDASYNARRRYYRSAERNLKKAENSSGATAARYRQLAKQDFQDALGTYENDQQKLSKPMQQLGEKLGVNAEEMRARKVGDMETSKSDATRNRLISSSTNVLEKNLSNEDVRREREARALLNNDKIGSRIMGGLVDVWKDKATVTVVDESGIEYQKIDNSKILPALFDYFEVDNLADMLEKVEKIIGDKLYKDEDEDTMYEAVKLMLQVHTLKNPVSA